jgi:hypothetical protein
VAAVAAEKAKPKARLAGREAEQMVTALLLAELARQGKVTPEAAEVQVAQGGSPPAAAAAQAPLGRMEISRWVTAEPVAARILLGPRQQQRAQAALTLAAVAVAKITFVAPVLEELAVAAVAAVAVAAQELRVQQIQAVAVAVVREVAAQAATAALASSSSVTHSKEKQTCLISQK